MKDMPVSSQACQYSNLPLVEIQSEFFCCEDNSRCLTGKTRSSCVTYSMKKENGDRRHSSSPSIPLHNLFTFLVNITSQT